MVLLFQKKEKFDIIIHRRFEMQLRLLNFYKFLSNFATSLVGTFIPLIIYKATGSLRLAIVYLFCQCLSRLICNHIFAKAYVKYPQLFLMLRIIPLLIYNIFLIFIEQNLVLSLVFIIVCFGMNLSFKNNANEILFNYSSSQKKSGKNLAMTRILECISSVVSTLAGGIFLDFNQTALIIISMVLYIISVMPIFIYFIVNRHTKGFNKDFVSNAVMAYEQDNVMSEKSKKLSRNMIINYFMIYMLFCLVDNFTNFYSLYLFIDEPTFTQAGYVNAVFNLSKMLSLVSVSWIAKKFDPYITSAVMAVLAGVAVVIIPLIQNYIGIYALFVVFGFGYEVGSYFMMQGIMSKARIAGVANKTLLARQDGIMVGQMLSSLFVFIVNDLMPVFTFMLVGLIAFAIYDVIAENRMRKDLVNLLQNNEIE